MSDPDDLSDLDSADYGSDFVAWTKEQALALRRRATNAIDWDNIAEEIESLGKSDQRDLRSRIQTILDHLMRLQASPAQDPRRGWERTLIVQRAGIRQLLDDSPSLKPVVPTAIAAELLTARRLATLALEEYGETPRVPLDQLSYTAAQVLGPWLPEAAA
jgi:1,6-anhydro-N-acetylmuramate kinase